MTIIKKLTSLLLIISFTLSLPGCATIYHRADGVIVGEKKLKNNDYKPHLATKTGAMVGGSVGAVGGGIIIGSIGFAIGGFLTNSIPLAILSALGGGLVGAVAAGAAGGALGGGFGYIVDVTNQDAGLYEFTVKVDNQPKTLTVTQYTMPIPLHTPVSVLEKDNLLFIKQK